LVELSKVNKTTIILTTHYIEEARKADRLGFMRNGRIIEEDTPQNLIDHHQTNVFIFHSIFLFVI